MLVQNLPLPPAAPGIQHHLTALQFGSTRPGPKAFIQAALHADEVPAMLVAHHLRQQLTALEAQGQLLGQVVLVPVANPVGLGQQVLGHHIGRFDLRDGVNFNRQHVDLGPAVLRRVVDQLGPDEAANVALIRQALRQAAAALQATTTTQALKHLLLQLSVDADVVLDLHCDAEATLHLYTLTPTQALGAELGALMGARAILLADESGDSPFDEACSRPWLALQQALPAHPIPLACFSATVELRGQADTSHPQAAQDAAAIIEFLRRRGVVGGTPAALPASRCLPTLLAASEPIIAGGAGIVVFHANVGDDLPAGALVAEVICPETGLSQPLRCSSAGVLYARSNLRWAAPGARLAKVAGSTLARTGKLLSN